MLKGGINFFITIIIIIIVGFLIFNSGFISFVKGSGEVEIEDIEVSNFDSILISIPADVYITQSEETSVSIEAESNFLDLIDVSLDDSKIIFSKKSHDVFRNTKPIKIYISAPEISEIAISSSADVFGKTPITADTLNLEITGTGKIDLKVSASVINTFISGTGDIFLEGDAETHYLKISGYGDVDASSLKTNDTIIFVSGSSKSEVYATDNLDITVSGAANIKYRGEPEITKQLSGYLKLIEG